MKIKKNFMIGGVTSGVVLIGLVIIFLMSTTTIKPGYAGVIYNMNGGVEKTVLSQGWHIIAPTQHVVSYPVSTETIFLSKDTKEGSTDDESFNVMTGSGKPANTSASYSYHMDANKLSDLFTKFRGQDAATIENNYIRAKFKSSFNTVVSQYDLLDYYGDKRPETSQKIFELFKTDMAIDGIVIENINIIDVVPDTATLKSIQEKVDAEQKLKTAKVLQEQATIDATTAKIKAEGEANAKIATANGEAKSNEALQASLTDKLVEYKKLEVAQHQADAMAKWNVSTYISGGSSTPFINLPAAK